LRTAGIEHGISRLNLTLLRDEGSHLHHSTFWCCWLLLS